MSRSGSRNMLAVALLTVALCAAAAIGATAAWAQGDDSQPLMAGSVADGVLTAQAASGATSDGWSWVANDDGQTATLTAYAGSSLAPAVPAQVDGLTVTGVVAKASTGAPAIASIDLSATRQSLTSLQVYGCALTSLDLSAFPKLAYVDVRGNQLTSLSLPPAAERVLASDNKLESLSVAGCANLQVLYCDNNTIRALDIAKCSQLYYLDCHENYLTELKCGANVSLNDVFCYGNYISEDLKALTDRYGKDQNVVLPQHEGSVPEKPVPATYTVTFDSDGGSAVASQVVTEGGTATRPANPSRSGYAFKEWQLDGKAYSFATPVVSNITLKAAWTANSTPSNPANPTTPAVESQEMYRLYNPNSGEHFYTAAADERNGLVAVGWKYEGVGWKAPVKSNTPVYRLYNENGGEHHYTTNVGERDGLVAIGWKDEGTGWYSDDARATPLLRLYNPNAFANNHHYTTSTDERDWLVSLGWKYEGIGWYGL